MISQAKNWLNRHPLAFFLAAPFSFRKRAIQMAWIGINARLLAGGMGTLCKSLVSRDGRVFLRTIDGILVAYDFMRRDGGLHPMYIYDQVYESAELEVIRKYFKPKSTFIDIGANIGMHSIRAETGNQPDGAVLAIEADEATFGALQANVRENLKSPRIQTRRAVLWSSITAIAWQGEQLEHGHNHAIAAKSGTGDAVISDTLDSLIDGIGTISNVSVIKIDVEGAEFEVLKGAERTLRAEKPALVIEIEDKYLARNGANAAAVRSYLRSLGYHKEVPIVNAPSGRATNHLFLQQEISEAQESCF
jgi:FkbM family methyltransferase